MANVKGLSGSLVGSPEAKVCINMKEEGPCPCISFYIVTFATSSKENDTNGLKAWYGVVIKGVGCILTLIVNLDFALNYSFASMLFCIFGLPSCFLH